MPAMPAMPAMPPRPRAAHRSANRRSVVATTVLALAALPGLGLLPAVAASTPQASFSDTEVTAGTAVTATVDRATRPAGSTLVLQRRFLDRWRTVDPKAEATADGPRFVVPSGQYGTFGYRVLARDERRVVATSATTRVTVEPTYDPLGDAADHDFITDPRTRWNSCSVIRWTFNRRNAPEHALRQLQTGFRRLQMATGHEFEYVGLTRQKPNPYGSRLKGAEVILGWRTSADYSAFGPGTVAFGGNTYFRGYEEADGSRVNRAFKGGVVFNADYADQLETGYGEGLTWGEVVIHELGHVMGLGHVDSDEQIMYPTITDREAQYGAGDLAGLRWLGDTRGCLTEASNRMVATGPVRWRAP